MASAGDVTADVPSETIYQIQAAIACQRLDFLSSSKKVEKKKNYKKLLNCDWLDFVFNLFVDDVCGMGGMCGKGHAGKGQ